MKKSFAVSPSASLGVSERIRESRVRAGLSKAELARRVGVCASAAVQWEHPYGTAPNATNLSKIAQATNVAYEWLATGRGLARPLHDDGTPALMPGAIAITLFEERLLEIARRLPAYRQEPLLAFLSAWTKDK
jgi:transcriptional regulator with XRE-family HTH domain